MVRTALKAMVVPTQFTSKQERNHLLRTQLRDRNTPGPPYITSARNPNVMTTQNAMAWKAKKLAVLRRLCCKNNIFFNGDWPLQFSVKSNQQNRSLKMEDRRHTVYSSAMFHEDDFNNEFGDFMNKL